MCCPSCSDPFVRNSSCDSRRFHLTVLNGLENLCLTGLCLPARCRLRSRRRGCNTVPEKYCSTCPRSTVSHGAVEWVSDIQSQPRRPTVRAQHSPAASMTETTNGGSIGRPHQTRDVYCNKGVGAWWRVVESMCWWSPSSCTSRLVLLMKPTIP